MIDNKPFDATHHNVKSLISVLLHCGMAMHIINKRLSDIGRINAVR